MTERVTFFTKIGKNGRLINIPKGIRDYENIQPGDFYQITLNKATDKIKTEQESPPKTEEKPTQEVTHTPETKKTQEHPQSSHIPRLHRKEE